MPCFMQAVAEQHAEAAPSTAATIGPVRHRAPARRPSLRAPREIAGTRVARTAGIRPAITVRTVPSSSGTTTVRVSIGRPASGSARPSALKSELSPLASPTPAARPTSEAKRPIANASSTTERSTWRREAPSVRSVASSRVRWATVIESVLKMTKPPTKSATMPKPTRK